MLASFELRLAQHLVPVRKGTRLWSGKPGGLLTDEDSCFPSTRSVYVGTRRSLSHEVWLAPGSEQAHYYDWIRVAVGQVRNHDLFKA